MINNIKYFSIGILKDALKVISGLIIYSDDISKTGYFFAIMGIFQMLSSFSSNIDSENLLEKGLEMGELIDEHLNKMATRNSFDCIGDVRRLGCMNAIELVKNKETREPDGELAAKVAQIALKNGLILVTAGPTRNVIRLLVPLTASTEVVTEGLNILEASLEEACR